MDKKKKNFKDTSRQYAQSHFPITYSPIYVMPPPVGRWLLLLLPFRRGCLILEVDEALVLD